MPANTRPAFRVLCRCLSGALGYPLLESDLPGNAGEWEQVLRRSSDHLVTPPLRWALRQQGLFATLPADVAAFLDAVYTLNLERNRECEDQLAQFIPVLNSIGVTPVLLKGSAAIVGGLYPTSGERMIGDLDVLVPVARLADILEVLAGIGYQPKVGAGEKLPDPVGYEKLGHHYPPVVCSEWSCLIELHVHPVHLPFVSLLSGEEVFRDALPLKWRGGDCALPSPTHFVMNNMIHSFLNNTQYRLVRVSIRQLFEFVLASRRYGDSIDWGAINSRFDRYGYHRAFQRYRALGKEFLDPDLASEASLGGLDRFRNTLHRVRLESDNGGIEWTINAVSQIKSRLASLRSHPERIKKLATAGFYSRLVKGICRGGVP